MEKYLREGETEILDNKKCPQASNLHNSYNFKSMICAYNPKHVDTCQVKQLCIHFQSNNFIS